MDGYDFFTYPLPSRRNSTSSIDQAYFRRASSEMDSSNSTLGSPDVERRQTFSGGNTERQKSSRQTKSYEIPDSTRSKDDPIDSTEPKSFLYSNFKPKSVRIDANMNSTRNNTEETTINSPETIEQHEAVSKQQSSQTKVVISSPVDSSDSCTSSTDESSSAPKKNSFDSSPAPSPDVPPICTFDHSLGKKLANFTVPTDPYTVFSMIFSNSKFLREFLSKRDTFDVVLPDWTEVGDTAMRTCTRSVKVSVPVGPNIAKVTERQVLQKESKPGFLYVVDVESEQAEVYNADAFYMKFHTCITRISANETQVIITGQMIFRKSLFYATKSIVEKLAWGAVFDFHKKLEQSIKEAINNNNEIVNTDFNRSLETIPCGSIEDLNQNDALASIKRRPLRRPKRRAPSIPRIIKKPSTLERLRKVSRRKMEALPNVTSKIFSILKSDDTLKFTIYFLMIAVISLNVMLYLRLENLEYAVQKIPDPSTINSEFQLGAETNELLKAFHEREASRSLERGQWGQALIQVVQTLQQVENELTVLRSFANGGSFRERSY